MTATGRPGPTGSASLVTPCPRSSAPWWRGRDSADALRLLRPGIDIGAEYLAREAAGRGERLADTDLYEDVRPAHELLRASGLRVVAAGNQTARAGELLRALDLPVDAVAASDEWGVANPSPEFFARVVDLAGAPPEEVLHVGEHPANDVFPARDFGLRTAHLRRGVWGHLWADDPDVRAAADWSINSLAELTDLLRG